MLRIVTLRRASWIYRMLIVSDQLFVLVAVLSFRTEADIQTERRSVIFILNNPLWVDYI
jgi:hypothetical protein